MLSPASSTVAISPIIPPKHSKNDDFDLMLLHEDFPILLAVAADLKEIREHIASHRSVGSTGPDNDVVVPVFQQIAKSTQHNDQVLNALDRMQKAFDLQPEETNVLLGTYPVIDSVLEDAIGKLRQEYESCEAWIQSQIPTTQAGGISFKKRDRGSLAIKYPKVQTDILMEWMIENRDDPFPSDDDLCLLAERTGLSTSQVVNWTTNVRKRNRKAVLDNKKKPHHFIDFLFLVQERENKKAESRRMFAWQQRRAPEYHRPGGHWQHEGPPNRAHPQSFAEARPHHSQRYSNSAQGNPSFHRRSNSQMYFPAINHHAPPPCQYRGAHDAAIPDTCISKQIFDEVDEDPSTSVKQYDDLMRSVKIEEWAEVEGYSHAENQERRRHRSPPKSHSPPARHIMPSVTMDSHDDSRERISSLDFEMEHHGKEIDDFVAKSITSNEENL